MAYQEQELGLLVRARPAEAKRRILAAYQKSSGYVDAAASILGVGARSLVRWTSALDLQRAVEKIRRAAQLDGDRHEGRPKKKIG